LTKGARREWGPVLGADSGKILDLLDDGIVLVDEAGKILLLNSMMEQLSGMTRAEARGMEIRDFIAGCIAPRLGGGDANGKDLTEILSSSSEERDLEFSLTGPGGERWFAYSSRVLRDPPFQGGLLDTFRDITERKRAEWALTERERRLSAIFEAAHNVAFVTTEPRGMESRILDFSPGAEMIFGYWKGDVVGERLAILHLPEDREKLTEIHRKMKRREVEFSGEITLVRKNGEQFPALLTIYPLRDESGAVRAALAVCIDITILKRAEAQIRASLLEKENLLREIHHRVKNNMQVVSALLVLQSKKTKDRKILEMFRDSEHRIKTMALIHEKLYQSKSFGTIDLTEYLTRLIQYLFRSYEERSAKVTLEMDVSGISLDIDTALPCSLIINELVSNSLKYAFPHGQGGKICIRVTKDAGSVHTMEIRDNGVGLPADLDMEKTETLGLRLVHGLAVNQLGGSIETGKGRGTSFIIRFPEMKK
jgi:PAS domain S-box-containing protein